MVTALLTRPGRSDVVLCPVTRRCFLSGTVGAAAVPGLTACGEGEPSGDTTRDANALWQR